MSLPKPHSYGQGTSGDDFMRPFYWADEAEAEVARLKCCATCNHRTTSGHWCSYPGEDLDIDFRDPCHFTPSRWAERGAE